VARGTKATFEGGEPVFGGTQIPIASGGFKQLFNGAGKAENPEVGGEKLFPKRMGQAL